MKRVLLVFAAAAAFGQTADYKQCETLKRHGDAKTQACYQQLTRSSDPMQRGEGFRGLRQWEDANKAFQEAEKARPKDAEVKVRYGFLFMEHWQPGDAAGAFKDALKLDPNNAQARLGLAMATADGYEAEATEHIKKALEADPKLYQAYEIAARIALEDNNPEKATEEAKKALAISPEAMDAMAVLATVEMLDDKSGKEWFDKIFKINPKYSEAYALAGHFFVINRRYDEGTEQYRKAIALEPTNYKAKSELAVGLMRFAKNAEAKALLEECWAAGYRDAQTTNTLTLIESYKNYDTFETPTTVLKIAKKESGALRDYFQAEIDKNIRDYEKKYKHKLTGQFNLEVYPDHEDFAVRTMGLPGLGALGVTFGNYVAMDSPSARKPGEFHWASTLRHEMSHVYVISMTQSRVPRWFTEGMAVYEETAENSDWGDRLDHQTIVALKEKKLLPIAELDRGFVHQQYPGQVIVSYFQAGRICTFIAEKWGYDTLLAMIHAFGDKKDTPEVVKLVLKMEPEAFDKQFMTWLDAQTKKSVDGFDEWRKRAQGINEASKVKDWDKVIAEGNAIRDIYPDYVEAGSIYEFLHNAYMAKNDKAKASAQLQRYSEVGGRDPELLVKLAEMQVEAGDKKGAMVTLKRLNLIFLKDEKAHQLLGGLLLEANDALGAVREYRAVIGLGSVDKAGSHFNLAKALQAAKRIDEAKEEVFLALEAAPSYRPAQKLMLELEGTK